MGGKEASQNNPRGFVVSTVLFSATTVRHWRMERCLCSNLERRGALASFGLRPEAAAPRHLEKDLSVRCLPILQVRPA
jgi:hypothetical protein